MPPIINAQGISKKFGIHLLFENLAFTVGEGERIGLIGPNGSGKSTLLQILEGRVPPDSGEVALRKGTKLAYVAQHSEFAPGVTVGALGTPEILGRAGFTDFDAEAAALSGGWKTRLAIVAALAQEPDVLLLDEPTNHLDVAGIRWIETFLQNAPFACVVVSHDRCLLENVASEVVELNRIYDGGMLRVRGGYSAFLEAKEACLHAQGKRMEALGNRVRAQIEWLRRGAKARRTKAKAQIDTANALIGELADLSSRRRSGTAGIDFTATDRKTKQLIDLEGVGCTIAGRRLFDGLHLTIQAGTRLGLAGPNGSGKTTLLRLLRGEIQPDAGEVRRADRLRIVYFDQNRELDPNLTLKRALAPDSDSVVYQERAIHVASWAARFLFPNDALHQPVGKLSGGERARVLIAQLMLQPADVLLLDEPANDLDIPTLEILEENLADFQGALVLVTHDRYMMDRIATVMLGLDGAGSAGVFADYAQWEEWQRRNAPAAKAADAMKRTSAEPAKPAAKKKLSYMEAREFATIEDRIAEAEAQLQAKQAELNDPAIASDAGRLLQLSAEIEAARRQVDGFVERWAELAELAEKAENG